MKHSFSRSEQVIHIWANKGDIEKIYSSNTTAQNGRLKSYSTTIAAFHNENIVFVSDTKHSITTTKHQSEISLALYNHNYTIIHVSSDFLNGSTGYSEQKNQLEKGIETLIEKQIRARVYDYTDSIKKAIQNYSEFCNYAKLEPITFSSVADLVKETKEKNENKAKELKEFTKKHKELVQTELDRMIAAWRSCKPLSVYDLFVGFTGKDRELLFKIMREKQHKTNIIRFNGKTIETDHGVELPLKEAAMLLRALKNDPDSLMGVKVSGLYRVAEITPDKLVIGCHTFDLRTELPVLEDIIRSQILDDIRFNQNLILS